MTCPNCNNHTGRIIVYYHDGKGIAACAGCRGISENGGARVSGILTRNSDRVRAGQHDHEGDIIMPHTFDKTTGQTIPNPEFVARYPDMLPTYFSQEELQKAGMSKAGKIFDKKAAAEAKHEKEAAKVEFAPDPEGAKLKEVIANV